MKEEINYRDQTCCSYQAVNMLICAVKLGILAWQAMGMWSQPHVASRGTAVFGAVCQLCWLLL